jgi:hypothetical protein
MRLSELLNCVHPLLFEDGFEGCEYSGGGTFFFARYGGMFYGITAKHCLKHRDKETIRLFIDDMRDGSDFIPVRRLHVIEDPEREACDWADLAFMELRDELLTNRQKSASWFVDLDYLIKHDVSLREGDQLVTRGCPNCLGQIDYDAVKIRNGFFAVDGTYAGVGHEHKTHVFRFSDLSQISEINGMSGSPVFKLKKWSRGTDYWFVGVILRGTKASGVARFVDRGVVFQAIHLLRQKR